MCDVATINVFPQFRKFPQIAWRGFDCGCWRNIMTKTLVRWHRAGFRCYWRWKSRPQAGRPQIETDRRALIRRMSIENPLWGTPRIHGELLKLGFEVAQSS